MKAFRKGEGHGDEAVEATTPSESDPDIGTNHTLIRKMGVGPTAIHEARRRRARLTARHPKPPSTVMIQDDGSGTD